MENIDELSLLNSLYKEKPSIIFISIKTNQLSNNLIRLAIAFNGSIYILRDLKNSKDFLTRFIDYIESNNVSIHVYNLKYFCKYLVANNIQLKSTKSFNDYMLLLYDRFGYHVDLLDKQIQNLVKVDFNDGIIEYYKGIYGTDNIAYQLLNSDDLDTLIKTEIIILTQLSTIVDQKQSEFIKTLHEASFCYAVIEHNGMKVDDDELDRVGYETVQKHFPNYVQRDPIIRPEYFFDRTKTGRLWSKFHNLNKKNASFIVSRYENGSLYGIDWNCFEFKVLLDVLEVNCSDEDPYGVIAEYCGVERKKAKSNIIKWMYGSEKYDQTIIEEVNRRYSNPRNFLDVFIDEAIKKLSIKTIIGKKIEFKDKDDARRKVINNIIQNLASFVSVKSTCKLVRATHNNLDINVVGTVYDEIILDISSGFENDFISLFNDRLFPAMLTSDCPWNSKVRYSFDIKSGQNLGSLKDG